jgi:hypothetical protein
MEFDDENIIIINNIDDDVADTLLVSSRTRDIQRELFFKNSKVLGLGRQIGLKFWGAF